MRRAFAKAFLEHPDPRKVLLTGDLGYGLFDEVPHINCGSSEQAMLDMAVGLSLEGKIPFCYSITPFLIYRPFETIRTYIVREQLHVILVGSGRDNDYSHDGYSHNASDVPAILRTIGLTAYFPTVDDFPGLVDKVIRNPEPAFISLKR